MSGPLINQDFNPVRVTPQQPSKMIVTGSIKEQSPSTVYTTPNTNPRRDWDMHIDMTDADNFEAPFLPHSQHTVFGADNTDQYWEHYI